MKTADVRRMTIPLRGAWKVSRNHRANRAIEEVKRHVVRHMKVTEQERIRIDESVNHTIWAWNAKTTSQDPSHCDTKKHFIEVKMDDEDEDGEA